MNGDPTVSADSTGVTRRSVLISTSAAVLGLAVARASGSEARLPAGMSGALPSTPASIAFNAFHAAPGAYATLTLGLPGSNGGFGVERTSPAGHDVLIGVEEADGTLHALPFFAAQSGDPFPLPLTALRRDYRLTTDDWHAGDLRLRVLSSTSSIPEPGRASTGTLREGLLPALLIELTLDNRGSSKPRRAFFGVRVPNTSPSSNFGAVTGGFSPTAGAMSQPSVTVSRGQPRGFVSDDGAGRLFGVYSEHASATAAAGESWAEVVSGSSSGTGTVGLMRFTAPPRKLVTFRLAVAFWHPGDVATNSAKDLASISARFWYTRLFSGITDVARYALRNHSRLASTWIAQGRAVDRARLSPDQRFQFVHAVRSYYGSTALLAVGNRPLWAVMEGGYGGINTFDLTVDHVFYEMRKNPWTVRNVLDWYRDRWTYIDNTNAILAETESPSIGVSPGASLHNPLPLPGGVSFTHDMGVWPSFSAPGASDYEKPGMAGVSAFMTAEQLTNWTLTALTYISRSGDHAWGKAHVGTLSDCLTSLVNRDGATASERDGVMSLETDREGPNGREITTYDALDPSLGQARHSAYLAGKQWAAYVCLTEYFTSQGRPTAAATARAQAHRLAATLVSSAKTTGFIPALLAADGTAASAARAIPAVEGLVFPLYAGAPHALSPTGEYADLMATMKRHLDTVLKPGVCLFPSGGWKLSSTSDNSWLSKVYLCQFISRHILGLNWDAAGRKADAVHVSWLTGSTPAFAFAGFTPHGADYWCWTDQFMTGQAFASFYYPRGVTSVLWLDEMTT